MSEGNRRPVDAAAFGTATANLVAEVARLSAEAERRRADIAIGEGMGPGDEDDGAHLRSARDRLAATEKELASAVDALGRAFAELSGPMSGRSEGVVSVGTKG